MISPESVERVRAGGGHRRGRLRAHRPAAPGRALRRPLPLPRGADALVLGRPAGEALLLLRLRGRRRRVPLRRGEGGAGVHRRRRAAGRALRGRARARARGPAGGGEAAQRRAARRGAGAHRGLLRELPLGLARRRRRRASTCWARARRGGAARVRRRLRAERLGPGADARPAGRVQRRGAARRPGWCSGDGGGGEYDRFRSRITFPVRDRRGRVVGFGGAGDARRAGRRSTSTRPRPSCSARAACSTGSTGRKAAIAKAGRAVVVEGYTDVLALHQAGIEEAVGGDGDGDHRGPGGGALGDGRGGRAGARRRLRGAGGDAAGAAGGGGAAGCGSGWRRCRPARTRRRCWPRRTAVPSASGSWSRARSSWPSSRSGWCSTATDDASPAERDRALREVAPVLAGMGETASRDELVRRVAERLDLEPAMVIGRVATRRRSGGPGEAPARGGSARRRAPAGRADLSGAARAGVAGDVHRPAGGGRGVPRAADRRAPLADRSARARDWLRDHLEDPVVGPAARRRRAGLAGHRAGDGGPRASPPRREAMELNFMLLEQRRLEARIGAGGGERRLRAPGRAEPRAGGAGRADRAGRAGRGMTCDGSCA